MSKFKNLLQREKCIELPDNFQVKNELFLSETDIKEHNDKEFIITGIKNNLTRSNMDVPTWAAKRSLMSKKPLPLTQVTFLPFIPSSVTDYATVYTAMKHFMFQFN